MAIDLHGDEDVVVEELERHERLRAAGQERDVGERLRRDVEGAGRRRLVDRGRLDLGDAVEARIAVPAHDAHRQAQAADLAVILEAPHRRLAQHLLRERAREDLVCGKDFSASATAHTTHPIRPPPLPAARGVASAPGFSRGASRGGHPRIAAGASRSRLANECAKGDHE